MFLGQFVCSVDASGRLELPDAFASALVSGGYLTQGFERNLIVVPAASFTRLIEQVTALSKTDPLARLLARLLLGSAAPLGIDESGCITVPLELRTFSGIGEQAVLVGGGDQIEVWSPESWETQRIRLQDAQSNAERFANLSLVVAS